MPEKIVIVDDRIHEIDWLTEFLEDELGRDFVLKTNEKDTREHFELLLEANPDRSALYALAIVDIMIPVAGMEDLVVLDEEYLMSSRDTGIRLCKFLRNELLITAEDMPIIVISARGDEELIREMRALGVPLFSRDDLEIRQYIKNILEPNRETA